VNVGQRISWDNRRGVGGGRLSRALGGDHDNDHGGGHGRRHGRRQRHQYAAASKRHADARAYL
jgi:hypothetical protein